jgi:hypothetical protein
MYTMENMELSEDDNIESGRHAPGLTNECEQHLKPESTQLPLNITQHSNDDDPLKMMYPNAMTREFAESCLVYSAHGLYIILTLVGWTIWRPLIILLPVAGITWELSSGCPLSRLEEWLFADATPFGHPSWKSRIFLWLDLAVFIVVGWFEY